MKTDGKTVYGLVDAGASQYVVRLEPAIVRG